MKVKTTNACTEKLLGVFFALVVAVFAIELLSFLATKASVLTFNESPYYTMSRPLGVEWRTEDDPWGAWHADNTSDRSVTDCFDIAYQSNNVGARDVRDYDDSLAEDSIVLVGDSFAEGFGVSIEDTFAKNIEEKTNRTVMNFGSAGAFGPVQEDLIYHELASQFPHNELIYLFYPSNDFTDNAPQSMRRFVRSTAVSRYRPYYQKTDDGYSVVYPEGAVRSATFPGSDGDESWINSIQRWLRAYTYTANSFRTFRNLVAQINLSIRTGRDGVVGGYFTDNAALVEGALFFVDQLLSRAQDKLITVIVIPSTADMEQISRGLVYHDKSWYVELKQIADDHSARFIDLAMHIPQDDYERLYLPCDPHWSPEGNAFVAERFLASSLAGPGVEAREGQE